MITFEIKKDGHNYHTVKMFENCIFRGLSMIFKDSCPDDKPFNFGDKKGNFQYYATFEEALIGCKAFLRGDPYADATDRINKSIEANVIAAKYKMNLRAAEFRGFLFNQVVQLKSGRPC